MKLKVFATLVITLALGLFVESCAQKKPAKKSAASTIKGTGMGVGVNSCPAPSAADISNAMGSVPGAGLALADLTVPTNAMTVSSVTFSPNTPAANISIDYTQLGGGLSSDGLTNNKDISPTFVIWQACSMDRKTCTGFNKSFNFNIGYATDLPKGLLNVSVRLCVDSLAALLPSEQAKAQNGCTADAPCYCGKVTTTQYMNKDDPKLADSTYKAALDAYNKAESDLMKTASQYVQQASKYVSMCQSSDSGTPMFQYAVNIQNMGAAQVAAYTESYGSYLAQVMTSSSGLGLADGTTCTPSAIADTGGGHSTGSSSSSNAGSSLDSLFGGMGSGAGAGGEGSGAGAGGEGSGAGGASGDLATPSTPTSTSPFTATNIPTGTSTPTGTSAGLNTFVPESSTSETASAKGGSVSGGVLAVGLIGLVGGIGLLVNYGLIKKGVGANFGKGDYKLAKIIELEAKNLNGAAREMQTFLEDKGTRTLTDEEKEKFNKLKKEYLDAHNKFNGTRTRTSKVQKVQSAITAIESNILGAHNEFHAQIEALHEIDGKIYLDQKEYKKALAEEFDRIATQLSEESAHLSTEYRAIREQVYEGFEKKPLGLKKRYWAYEVINNLKQKEETSRNTKAQAGELITDKEGKVVISSVKKGIGSDEVRSLEAYIDVIYQDPLPAGVEKPKLGPPQNHTIGQIRGMIEQDLEKIVAAAHEQHPPTSTEIREEMDLKEKFDQFDKAMSVVHENRASHYAAMTEYREIPEGTKSIRFNAEIAPPIKDELKTVKNTYKKEGFGSRKALAGGLIMVAIGVGATVIGSGAMGLTQPSIQCGQFKQVIGYWEPQLYTQSQKVEDTLTAIDTAYTNAINKK